VKPSGAITVAWPHLAPWEIPETCALDVAERGEHTLDEIGDLLNLSHERVRNIEARALARLHEEHGEELARLWRGEVTAHQSTGNATDLTSAAATAEAAVTTEATEATEAIEESHLASSAGGW
jgi:hypothetical protein